MAERLERMRRHMAEDKLIKIEQGRYGWTRYAIGSKADEEMPTLPMRHGPREREAAEP